MIFFAFFCKKIWSYQKNVVTLQRNSKRSYKTILHNHEKIKFTIMLKINDNIVTKHFDIFANGCILEFPYKNG